MFLSFFWSRLRLVVFRLNVLYLLPCLPPQVSADQNMREQDARAGKAAAEIEEQAVPSANSV
jgi:hypothetical protein